MIWPSLFVNWPQGVNIGLSKGLVSSNNKPLTKLGGGGGGGVWLGGRGGGGGGGGGVGGVGGGGGG